MRRKRSDFGFRELMGTKHDLKYNDVMIVYLKEIDFRGYYLVEIYYFWLFYKVFVSRKFLILRYNIAIWFLYKFKTQSGKATGAHWSEPLHKSTI